MATHGDPYRMFRYGNISLPSFFKKNLSRTEPLKYNEPEITFSQEETNDYINALYERLKRREKKFEKLPIYAFIGSMSLLVGSCFGLVLNSEHASPSQSTEATTSTQANAFSNGKVCQPTEDGFKIYDIQPSALQNVQTLGNYVVGICGTEGNFSAEQVGQRVVDSNHGAVKLDQDGTLQFNIQDMQPNGTLDYLFVPPTNLK